MSNVADYLEHSNVYRIKLDGAVEALERLHRQISSLEIACTLNRNENQDYSQQLAELETQWKHVRDLAMMVLESHDYGKSAYFDPNEFEQSELEEVSEIDRQVLNPRKLTDEEQKTLFANYAKWEEQIEGFRNRSFKDEEALDDALNQIGLEAFFETRSPNSKPFRFCRVLWPDPENAGEWVEMAELVVDQTGDGIMVSDIFYPTR
jgi:chromosome segregation ATPase